MKIYHYTKGISINGIFTDGFIATESKRGLNKLPTLTDCVWLTVKNQFPKTALPLINDMPETNLMCHINKSVYVDLNKVSLVVGGLYRFSFDSSDNRFKFWWLSSERKAIKNNVMWKMMESIANKVKDEVSSFWISSADVKLESFTLEIYEDSEWKEILTNVSLSTITKEQQKIIDDLTLQSKTVCESLNLPTQQVRLAA